VEIDMAVLERLKARVGDAKHDGLYLIKSTYSNGTVMYNAQVGRSIRLPLCSTAQPAYTRFPIRISRCVS
jgi:hypothetical protein